MSFIEKQQARLVELKAAKKAIEDAVAPINKKRDALSAKIGPLEAERRKLGDEATQIERGGNMQDICMEIAAIHRTLGARSLKAEPGNYAGEQQAVSGKK